MLTTTCLRSIDELRTIVPEWNELWQCSSVTSAVHRAESLLSLLKNFMSNARLCVLTVRDEGQLVAALPIVERRQLLGLKIGGLPNNEWSQPGTLLIDTGADHDAISVELAVGLKQAGCSLIRFDQIDLDLPTWTSLQKIFAKKKVPHQTILQYELGSIDVRGDFDTLLSERSKNLRSTLRRRRRRLEEQGEIRFTMHDKFSPKAGGEPLEPLLQKMFELEQKSWKHKTGGAVLDNQSVFEFYVQLAKLMDQEGAMRIALLELNDRLIAYDLAVESKRVYHSYKVSYASDFQRYGPGQLLHEDITQYACDAPGLDAIEYCGPMDDAIAAWATSHHRVGHLTFASSSSGLLNHAVWMAYRTAAGARRLLRR